MLQPKYTMHGFEWKDKRGDEGTGFVRALRSLLTAHLPVLTSHLKIIVEKGLLSETQRYMKADSQPLLYLIRNTTLLQCHTNRH